MRSKTKLWYDNNNRGNSTNIPIIAFPVSKYGKLNANFIIPPEFSFSQQTLATLYALILTSIGGSLVPSITNWIKVRKQRKRTELAYLKIIQRLDHKSDKFNQEVDDIKGKVLDSFTKGDISESQYETLNKTLENSTVSDTL